MPRFFIIDQSLCKAAGHHFDYTRNLAQVAADKQFETVVGANRDFNGSDPLLFSADALRTCFTNTTYSSLSELHGLRSLTRSRQPPSGTSENTSWLAARRYHTYARSREKYVKQFYLDCHSFFGDKKFTAEDQIFFVTVSELESEGLAQYLAEHPSAGLASWHLQFHFELFPPTAADANCWIEKMRTLFQKIEARVPDCVFFYATSAGLSQQYNRLGTFDFETLAYPVNAGFFQHRGAKHRKIQVACFGGIRREKGLKTLVPKLVKSFEKDGRVKDEVELVVQGKPSELSPKSVRDSKMIRWVPLPAENYSDLVHEADIGLLYYDRETFANRVSSTLNEFLCAGKPVIVSSASWLHEKILSPIADYQLLIFERSKVVWSSANPDRARDSETSSITIPLDGFEKTHRLLTIKGCAGEGMSTSDPLMVTTTNFSGGQTVATKTEVTSHCRGTDLEQSIFVACTEVSAEAEQVKLTFSSAGKNGAIDISPFKRLDIALIESMEAIPKSQTGIAVANEEDVFAAIKHLSQHRDHFHRTAREFSLQIQDAHRPTATFEQLLQRSDLRRM